MRGRADIDEPSTRAKWEKLDSRCAALLFTAFSFFYLLGLGGHIYTPDGTVMYRVAERLAFEGRLDAQPIEDWEDFGGTWVADSGGARRFYAKYGIGTSLAAVPMLWAGRLLLPLARERERGLFAQTPPPFEFQAGDSSRVLASPRGLYYPVDRAHFQEAFLAFAATWLNALVVAGVVTGIFRCARLLGYSTQACLGLAAVSGLASPLWHYSKEFFSEPLGAFGVIWFLYFVVKASTGPTTPLWGWAGGMLGVSILAKPAHVVLLLPATVPLAWHWSRLERREAFGGALRFALGLGATAAIALAYNAARFGSPFETGYGRELGEWTTPLWEGIRGLLASPGRGLFIYAPAVVLSLLMMPRFATRAPELAAFGALSLLTLVLFYARWYMWEGGWCWGPRFLVPILPAVLLPLAVLFERPPVRSAGRLAVAVILAASFVVALSGVVVGYHEYCRWLKFEYDCNEAQYAAMGITHYYDMMRWKLAFSPLIQYWIFPVKDYFLLPHALRSPGLVMGLFVTWGVGLAVSLVGLVRCLRRRDVAGVATHE